jgi:predicted transcriptional regulator
MGQADVLKLLEKVKEPLSGSEIASKLGERSKEVFRHLRIMIKYGEVSFVEIDRNEALKKYSCKRRMKLYFIARS